MNEPEMRRQPRLIVFNSLIDELIDDAEARNAALREQRPLGPLTGFKEIDLEIGGCLAEGLNVLHGAPGTGKTAFALQIAAHSQCPCLFVTCEMTPIELLRRQIARVTKTYLGRLKTGELPAAKVRELAIEAVKTTPHLAILDATNCAAPPESLRIALEATRRLNPENRHLLLVVDSIHAWVRGVSPPGSNEYEALNEGLETLRILASQFAIPVLGVGERNRASMKSGGMSAAAGSRLFEYSAETVIDLERKEEAAPDAKGCLPVTLRLVKNRHGTPGKTFSLEFHGATQSFKESF